MRYSHVLRVCAVEEDLSDEEMGEEEEDEDEEIEDEEEIEESPEKPVKKQAAKNGGPVKVKETSGIKEYLFFPSSELIELSAFSLFRGRNQRRLWIGTKKIHSNLTFINLYCSASELCGFKSASNVVATLPLSRMLVTCQYSSVHL